jgi:hypothetical protein
VRGVRPIHLPITVTVHSDYGDTDYGDRDYGDSGDYGDSAFNQITHQITVTAPDYGDSAFNWITDYGDKITVTVHSIPITVTVHSIPITDYGDSAFTDYGDRLR